MFTKQITYTNFDGQEVTENLYFHLTKTEMMKLETSVVGGLSNKVFRLMGITKDKAKDANTKNLQEKNVPEMVNVFETLILSGYGIKTDTGSFIKNEQIKEEFKCSEAYSTLFIELMENPEECANFFKALIPTVKEEVATK